MATEFETAMAATNVAPLWNVLSSMVPASPNPLSAPTIWRYSTSLRPLLIQSGSTISAEEAERRVLMLVNPSPSLPGAPYTTDTIYAGLQLILPGETAPAHRHVAFALRFIVEGSKGFTAVDGHKLVMERGDVILTPSWGWHDHGNEGDGPMIWLDGLDLPVFRFLRVNFAENFAEERYPSEAADREAERKLKIPWAEVQGSLDGNLHDVYARYDYRLPSGVGGEEKQHLSKTISAQAERIQVGKTSPRVRETVSFVYHVYEGEGYSTVVTPDGKEDRIEWKSSDTFSVPAWSTISHTATGGPGGSAYLFAVNDRPMIESLGLYRMDTGV
ncbi:RmlC-like cupin domain-protein [Rhypophila decipiens]|uniref:RmlC-like cupin domain-protein n=1 Tax=Rhypophila decipiens TaxID=261697 RepID=A0AAN7B2E7_9PEZI|nr:RmlC-like cupin domain-protein [Rhypophila decipiens]